MNSERPEKHADRLDLAAEIQDDFNARGVAAASAAAAPESHPDFDGKHCLDCATIIPKARRDLGKIRCIGCQEALELTQRGYR